MSSDSQPFVLFQQLIITMNERFDKAKNDQQKCFHEAQISINLALS